jgi:hypothetical protein
MVSVWGDEYAKYHEIWLLTQYPINMYNYVQTKIKI